MDDRTIERTNPALAGRPEGPCTYTVAASQGLPSGLATVTVDFAYDGGVGKGGNPRDHVRRARQLVEDIDRSLHFLTWELRPAGALEHHGLAIALENLMSAWSERFGMVIVEDDGRGFDAAQVSAPSGNHGLGLVSMRKRASLCGGTLDIDAARGRGTTIFVRIPLAAEPAPPDA